MDSKLIQQTIINLIDNAHKHSPEGQPIEVIIEDNFDDTVSVMVKDHGTGIDQKRSPCYFQHSIQLTAEMQKVIVDSGWDFNL